MNSSPLSPGWTRFMSLCQENWRLSILWHLFTRYLVCGLRDSLWSNKIPKWNLLNVKGIRNGYHLDLLLYHGISWKLFFKFLDIEWFIVRFVVLELKFNSFFSFNDEIFGILDYTSSCWKRIFGQKFFPVHLQCYSIFSVQLIKARSLSSHEH